VAGGPCLRRGPDRRPPDRAARHPDRGGRARRGLDVATPPPPRHGLSRRVARGGRAAGAPGPARGAPHAHLHRADEGRRADRDAPEDLHPQRRAQTLVRGGSRRSAAREGDRGLDRPLAPAPGPRSVLRLPAHELPAGARRGRGGDRKSTRLNSSHVSISYAVFCLKKKNKILVTYSAVTERSLARSAESAPLLYRPRTSAARRPGEPSTASSRLPTTPPSFHFAHAL